MMMTSLPHYSEHNTETLQVLFEIISDTSSRASLALLLSLNVFFHSPEFWQERAAGLIDWKAATRLPLLR